MYHLLDLPLDMIDSIGGDSTLTIRTSNLQWARNQANKWGGPDWASLDAYIWLSIAIIRLQPALQYYQLAKASSLFIYSSDPHTIEDGTLAQLIKARF